MKKKRLKKIATYKKKTTYIWIILALFIVVSLFFTIQTATAGAELSQLEYLKSELNKENQDLKREIIRLSSLTNIEGSAEELGFIKPQKVFYISEEIVVAKVR